MTLNGYVLVRGIIWLNLAIMDDLEDPTWPTTKSWYKGCLPKARAFVGLSLIEGSS